MTMPAAFHARELVVVATERLAVTRRATLRRTDIESGPRVYTTASEATAWLNASASALAYASACGVATPAVCSFLA